MSKYKFTYDDDGDISGFNLDVAPYMEQIAALDAKRQSILDEVATIATAALKEATDKGIDVWDASDFINDELYDFAHFAGANYEMENDRKGVYSYTIERWESSHC